MWQQGGNSQLAEVPRRMLQGRFGAWKHIFNNHYGTFPTKVEAAERWIAIHNLDVQYISGKLCWEFVVFLIQFERAKGTVGKLLWVCSCIAASETALFCWGNYLRFVPHMPWLIKPMGKKPGTHIEPQVLDAWFVSGAPLVEVDLWRKD